MKYLRRLDDQRGSILLVFILTLPFLIAITMYYMSLSLTSYQVARFDQFHSEAQLAADAGADYGVEQLSQDSTWTGTNGDITLHSDSQVRTTYNVSVSGNSSSRTLAVTGKTFFPASSTTPNRSVSIYVDMYPVTTGNYSIVAGTGGLYMSNSAKILGGSVFINGELQMSNSAQIGLLILPVNVQVADEICPNPPDATYPRVCNSGENGQPISITNTAHIYGQVTATNQTNGNGMSGPGLVSGSVPPAALPTYDRAGQKAAVTNNLTGAAASCSGGSNVIWPANTKITGDVTLTQHCSATVKGNVWITGTLTLSNLSSIIIDNSVGTMRPNIMVDGGASGDGNNGITLGNSSSIISNLSGTGAEFYTFYSTAACSPDCASVTGTDLANSRIKTTISISNSLTAANSIFYAYWSQVQLANTGQIGAVIGQTIQLSNTAAITFGSSAGAGTTVWVIKGYRRQ